MKINLLKSAMLAVVLVAGISSAQATPPSAPVAPFTKIGGTNIDFFYLTDFWSGSTASVVNNVLTFTPLDGFSATVAGGRNAATTNVNDDSASGSYASNYGVVAVAKGGYTVANNVVLGVKGDYTLAATKGMVSVTSSADVYSGTFSGGTRSVFSNAQYITNNVASESQSSTNSASTGSFNATSPDEHVLLSNSVLGLDTYLTAVASQQARSTRLTSTSSLTEVSYGFTAVQVVPEPETYAMMLAGLGLLGVAARRKKQA